MVGRRSARIAAVVAAVGLFAAACGGSSSSSSSAGGGSIAKDPQLANANFKVGSKEFDEQLVLGQITLQVLEAAGAKVEDKTGINGTTNTRNALTSGQIDMYWEYTGTGWVTHLKHTTPIRDEQGQFDAVAKEDLQKNNIKWVPPFAPFNNTYAIASRADFATQNNIKTASDLANYIKANPSQGTFCVESEFASRDDGLVGFLKTYGINVPKSQIKTLDTGVVYTETQKGQTCNFGEVFTTDGRISSLKLTPFTDDKKFFPNYNPALTMKADLFNKYPDIAKIFAPVSAKLTNNVMTGLNAQVSAQGDEPKTVAKDWLTQNGFIK
jgi:osmoprotectant transport system substrate-binding protein